MQEYFEKLGKDYYTETINYENFEKKALSEIRRLDNIEELRNAFITLDFSCKGFLTIEDLQKQFDLIAPRVPLSIIQETFRFFHSYHLKSFEIIYKINKIILLSTNL